MGIAAGILFVFLIFATSMSKFIGEDKITDLSSELQQTTIIKIDLEKELEASKEQSTEVSKELEKIREQLTGEVKKRAETQKALLKAKEFELTEDDEYGQISEVNKKKMIALEERVKAVLEEKEKVEKVFRQRNADVRRQIDEIDAENEELLLQLEEMESASAGADASSLNSMIQNLAAENLDLKTRVEKAESAVAKVEEANRRMEELSAKNAELEKKLNELRKASEQN